jgi:hypothetical protein
MAAATYIVWGGAEAMAVTLCALSSSQSFAGVEAVLNRYAFRRRTASDLEAAAPIGIGPLTVAFGDVQRDRRPGT